MKKKIKIIAIIVLVLLVLFVPIPNGRYKDGGTKFYTALTYKVVHWNVLFGADGVYSKTRLYLFPDNFKSYSELLELEDIPYDEEIDGQESTGTTTDYPAAIMVEGEVYLYEGAVMTTEIMNSVVTGYTTSYTDTFPQEDGETNFSRELNLPYVKVEDGIAILVDEEWHLCTPKDF